MPDLDIESLARRAGVEADAWRWKHVGWMQWVISMQEPKNGVPCDWTIESMYSAPAVSAMLAQMRREVLEEAARECEALYGRTVSQANFPPGTTFSVLITERDCAAALRRLAEKG